MGKKVVRRIPRTRTETPAPVANLKEHQMLGFPKLAKRVGMTEGAIRGLRTEGYLKGFIKTNRGYSASEQNVVDALIAKEEDEKIMFPDGVRKVRRFTNEEILYIKRNVKRLTLIEIRDAIRKTRPATTVISIKSLCAQERFEVPWKTYKVKRAKKATTPTPAPEAQQELPLAPSEDQSVLTQELEKMRADIDKLKATTNTKLDPDLEKGLRKYWEEFESHCDRFRQDAEDLYVFKQAIDIKDDDFGKIRDILSGGPQEIHCAQGSLTEVGASLYRLLGLLETFVAGPSDDG